MILGYLKKMDLTNGRTKIKKQHLRNDPIT